MYRQFLNEEPSLFATHPTFRQRVEAMVDYPETAQEEPESALELFENGKEIEEELTQFLTQVHGQLQSAGEQQCHTRSDVPANG